MSGEFFFGKNPIKSAVYKKGFRIEWGVDVSTSTFHMEKNIMKLVHCKGEMEIEEIKILLGIEDKNIEIVEVKCEGGIIITTIKSKTKKYLCPNCNKTTSSVHDTLKPIQINYLKAAEKECKLLLIKRRFICHKCKNKFTEEMNMNGKKASISNKTKIKIRKDLLNYNLSIKYIAESNNVNDMTVRNELLDAMAGYPNHVRLLPSMISFDEFKADTKKGKFAFVINDLLHKKTLDILPSRKKEDLIQYFTYIENRSSVQYIVSDMYEPYLLVQKILFPRAKFCVDRFHYIRYIMRALDGIRIRLQDKYGYKSKEYSLLKNKKNISLLRKYGNDIEWFVYTKRYRNGHMVEVLAIDVKNELLAISEELKKGYYLKEEFLDIVRHATNEDAEEQFLSWVKKCHESNLIEFKEASGTIERWLPYIVNSFIDKKLSQGFTEGRNNKFKVIKRIAYGYKNFEFLRLRIMYICNGKLEGGSNAKSRSRSN